jgi:hypothetical protein
VLIPVKPKRNASAYMFFINKYMRDEQAKAEPGAKWNVAELTKSGAKVWNEMPAEQKTEFNL